jgi:WD40 repeat protein
MVKWVKGWFKDWRKLACSWFLVGAVILALLGLQLQRNASPWALELVIPSGFDEDRHRNVYADWGRTQRCDLSLDGRLLLIGRPDSTCEIWDLETDKRKAVFGKPKAPDPNDDHPGLRGAKRVYFLPGGEEFLVLVNNQAQIYDIDAPGEPRLIERTEAKHRVASITPDGRFIALASGHAKTLVRVYDSQSGEKLYDRPTRTDNRLRIRLTPDGRHLVISHEYALEVWSISEDKLVFRRQMLDVRLPQPMFGDDESRARAVKELTTRPSAITRPEGESLLDRYAKYQAVVSDTILLDGGKVIACLYEARDGYTGDRLANRLRFYDTLSGEVLLDDCLKWKPNSLALSADGSQLLVQITDYNNNLVHRLRRYNVPSGELVDDITFGVYMSNVDSVFTPSPDGRWIVVYNEGAWLIDTQQKCAPLRLLGSPRVADVRFTPDGKTLIEVGLDKTVRIWRLRREISHLGAWGLAETWAIQATIALTIFGVLLIAGTVGGSEQIPKPPVRLWAVALLFGAMLAIIASYGILTHAVDAIYTSGAVTMNIWMRLAVPCISLLAMVKILRLNDRWRKNTLGIWALMIVIGVLPTGQVIQLWAASGFANKTIQLPIHGCILQTNLATVSAVMLGMMALNIILWLNLAGRKLRPLFKQKRDPTPQLGGDL